MAAKVLYLLALLAAVVSAANTADGDCNCEPPTELETSALWDFFKKLDAAYYDNDPSDNNLGVVLPSELSPLLECNCLEKNRRKRKIMPESVEETKEIESSESDEDLEGLRSPKCPHGYVWYRILCVNENFRMMDK